MDKTLIDDIEILELDFAHLLKKGYKKNIVGNEYIYDCHIPRTPIMMKISSSIIVDKERKPNKNSYCIRVHAVRVNKEGKIIGGLVNAVSVSRTIHWRIHLRDAYISVRKQAFKIVYDEQRKKK